MLLRKIRIGYKYGGDIRLFIVNNGNALLLHFIDNPVMYAYVSTGLKLPEITGINFPLILDDDSFSLLEDESRNRIE